MSRETTKQVEPTPGDWQYHDTGRLIKCGPHVIIGFLYQDNEVRSQQVAANGYVMAAAPELLAACEAIHARLDYIQTLWGKKGVTDGQVRLLKDAIAKARGGQS